MKIGETKVISKDLKLEGHVEGVEIITTCQDVLPDDDKTWLSPDEVDKLIKELGEWRNKDKYNRPPTGTDWINLVEIADERL